SFFATRAASDEEETAEFDDDADDLSDDEAAAAEESWNRREIKDCGNLLDLAKSVLPSVILKVHYRSSNRELIPYSNNAFYHGELNVPVRHPQAEIARRKPIELIQIDGLYHNRTNRAEAEQVVELLSRIWRSKEARIPTT